ncbi:hypothetical protein [Methylocaldum szegediense]|uniref:Uncharacterized protein n=1 Tax=Methylocaldum szegediense TaxID=73780 RepID=A0ABM9I892_9GAMM|nr:hypothetical protein [Methylocaldum szegediense]CAI8955276.1 protein of unknown function [Methylocaldum szegediense]
MIEDLFEFVVAAAIDVKLGTAAKKHRWVCILRAFLGLFFFALIVGAIYVTLNYS